MKSRVHAVDGPYDEFCPSLQKDLSNRVCKHFHSYFTSAASVSRHRKGCLSFFGIPVPKSTVFIDEEDDDSDAEIGEKDEDDIMPVIIIGDILNSPFIEIDVEEEGDEDE